MVWSDSRKRFRVVPASLFYERERSFKAALAMFSTKSENMASVASLVNAHPVPSSRHDCVPQDALVIALVKCGALLSGCRQKSRDIEVDLWRFEVQR